MFAHMSLERGLGWYKKLLSLTLPEQKELNINAKNCVGTVLSLNGHRKYFCMYHAKHPECKDKGSKVCIRIPLKTTLSKNQTILYYIIAYGKDDQTTCPKT